MGLQLWRGAWYLVSDRGRHWSAPIAHLDEAWIAALTHFTLPDSGLSAHGRLSLAAWVEEERQRVAALVPTGSRIHPLDSDLPPEKPPPRG